jgi:protein-disulfide isomerase/uncharacterized membrane protein
LRPSVWLFLLRIASLLGLSVSTMALLDYSRPDMAFCGVGSGCAAVRDSGLGFVVLPSGNPFPYLPILGVLNFGALFAGSLFSQAKVRRVLSGTLALASGPAGLVLLVLQAFVIRHFCSLCLIVDVSSLVVFACAVLLRRGGWDQATALEPIRPASWIIVSLLAFAAPLAFTSVARTNELPPALVPLQEPGKATVVEFFDYQCPHCRMAIPELERAVRDFRLPVRVVRQPLSLPGRELGKRAARAHACAVEQNKEALVMRALIQGEELTEWQLAGLQHVPGLDQAQFLSCLESARPDRVIEVHLKRVQSLGFEGVPTTYIGAQRIVGGAPYETYLAALEKAGTGQDTAGMEPVLYWLQFVALAAFTLWVGRRKPRAASA